MNTFFLWQQGTAASGGSPLISALFWVAALAVIYFFIFRPNQKKQKESSNFLQSLKKGQKVVSIGGVHGTIVEVQATTIVLMIAPKTFITVQRDCISKEYSEALQKAANAGQTEITVENVAASPETPKGSDN